MNEQIYQFAEQAAEHALLNPSEESLQSEAEGYDTIIVSRAFIDKFAELIVRECYDISLKAGHPISELKKHFGVE